MKIPELSENLSIISQLGNNPGTDDGLSADELKAKFDEAVLIIQRYINQTLLPKVNASVSPEDGLTMRADIAMGGHRVTDVAAPEEDGDAMNLGYADKRYRRSNWMPSASDVGAVPKVTIVTTEGTDLNNYIKEGVYYFDTTYKPTNVPFGSNGWLEVKPSGTGRAKQIWYRYGTLDSNDHQTASRTCSADGTWSQWTNCVDTVIAQGTSGDWTYRKWASGIAECWMSGFDFGKLGASAGGSNRISQAFPFTFANTNLTQIVEIQASEQTHKLTANFVGKYANYCEMSVHNFGTANVTSFKVDIYITGRWK